MVYTNMYSSRDLFVTLILIVILIVIPFSIGSNYDCKFEIAMDENSEYLKMVNYGKHLQLAYSVHNSFFLDYYDENICFTNKKNETEFIFRLKKTFMSCTNMSPALYSVPLLSAATCNIKESSNVWGTNHELCSLVNKSQIINFFDANDLNVIDVGCLAKYRSFNANNYWWLAYLEVFNVYVDIKKCIDIKLKYEVEVDFISENKINKTVGLVLEDDKTVELKHANYSLLLNLNLTVISAVEIPSFCLLYDPLYNKTIAVVDNCNAVDNLAVGAIGEIQCKKVGNNMSCASAPELLNIMFSDANIIGCRLNNIYYPKILIDNKLPMQIDNYIIDTTDEEGLSVAIEKLDPNLVFNLKTDVIVDSKIEKDICDLTMLDRIEQDVKINGSSNFTVRVRSHSKVIISTQCEDSSVTVKNEAFVGSGVFENVKIVFFPTTSKIRTKCKIFCDDIEKKDFELVGRYEFESIQVPTHILKNGKEFKFRADPEEIPDNPLSMLWDNVVDFFKSTIGKITAALSTLLITVIGVLILLTCLGKIDCLKLLWKLISCCGCGLFKFCCKKKNSEEEEGVELEEIKVMSKKLLNNVYYSYDNHKISIFNDDYTIKASGIFCQNLKIVESIPKIMFYKDSFVCKNNSIVDTNLNKTIIKNLDGDWELNSNYIIVKNIVYSKEDLKEPLILVRSKKAPEMKILDTKYKNIDNSLYLDNDIIIKNIFIDF